MQIVIPMAGIGKRFIEAGYKEPKPFIKVDGKPMIQHVYELFNEKETYFIMNEEHATEDNVNKIFDICPSAYIHYVSNENKKGPVDAVRQMFHLINSNDEVIVSYCDFGTSWNYNEFLIQARKADGAIACYTGFHPHMLGSDNYAFVKMDGEYAVKVQEKKPFTDDRMSEFASNGIYYFKSGKILKHYFQKLYDQNITVGGEFYVSEVYNLMIEDGLKVVCPLIDKMLQWGTPRDLEIYKKWSDCFNYPKQEERAICPPETTLILPMAGKGSRFSDVGYDLPKPLLPVDGLPMFAQAVKCLPECDNAIYLIREDFGGRVAQFTRLNDLQYVLKEVTKGQACTCEIGVKDVDPEKSILISACDNGVKYDHTEWNELVNDECVDVIVWTFRNNPTVLPNPDMYSYVTLSRIWKDNSISAVSSKKCPNDYPMKTHAIIGTFFFRKARYFTEALQKNYKQKITTNDEYYVDDVIQQCVNSGLRVHVFEVDHYICWGTSNDYKTYNYWSEYFN